LIVGHHPDDRRPLFDRSSRASFDLRFGVIRVGSRRLLGSPVYLLLRTYFGVAATRRFVPECTVYQPCQRHRARLATIEDGFAGQSREGFARKDTGGFVQFHLNGFEAGDPEIFDSARRYPPSGASGNLPEEVDVLIVGCGPAGLTLAAQLSAFADVKTCIVEQKAGPLLRGQADGIACRTMEMFEAFGFSERVVKEACWINETTFWKPDDREPQNIVRSGRVQDVEDGLSEFPHVVLNQARVHDFYLDVMRRSPAGLEPHYGRRVIDLQTDLTPASVNSASEYPVTVRLERLDPAHKGQIETVKARYVVGCDGARSTVRKCIGRALHGDSTNHAWGVMDVLAVTDFPDIRLKTLIQSGNGGSILIIPREGGYLFRLYIEMDKLDVGERVSSRNITADHLIAGARRISYSRREREAWGTVGVAGDSEVTVPVVSAGVGEHEQPFPTDDEMMLLLLLAA
jgi:2-polyprenyl-6-methoxyphenol hydroxylase-like FAD-dependent oxidoreductase